MTHYVVIIEEGGPDTAVGVWFPDLLGCFSAGDTVDEALRNATDAIAIYAETLEQEGLAIPSPRTLSVLKEDPRFSAEVRDNMVALVAAPPLPAVAG